MKIQSQLWLVLTVLFLATSLGVYLVVADAYEERLQASYEQVAFAQGAALLEDFAQVYPESPQRLMGYLQKYSEQLQARLIILDAEKKVFADSFEVLPPKTRLELAVLNKGEGYASHFAQNDAFGYVQYTLMPFCQSAGYLLLIQEAEALSAELSTFRSWMLRVLSLAVVILFLLSYVVAAWLTEPIRKIIAALKQITPRKRVFALTYRRQDEIKELIEAIAGMVAELNLYDERQRRFLSTSSHELKTPLATMQLILENLPYVRSDEERFQEFTQDLVFQVQKMKQMVEQLLQIMRLGDRPLQKEDVSARELKGTCCRCQHRRSSRMLLWSLSCRMSLFMLTASCFCAPWTTWWPMLFAIHRGVRRSGSR